MIYHQRHLKRQRNTLFQLILGTFACGYISSSCARSTENNGTEGSVLIKNGTSSSESNNKTEIGDTATQFSTAENRETESVFAENDTNAPFDVSNMYPLEPTADCIHPEVQADCDKGWCRIPNGCFVFGSVDSEGNKCRGKFAEDQVQVTLTHDFEIRQTEITQEEWQEVGFDLPSPLSLSPCPDCPISWITIYEAMAYCNAISKKTGLAECYDLSDCKGEVAGGCPNRTDPKYKWGCSIDETHQSYVCMGNVQHYSDPYTCPGYRLPTTAEWEYAARAGTRTANYAGDLEKDISTECMANSVVDDIAWHCGNTEGAQNEPQYRSVGRKKPNDFGLYDMIGNAGEFCASTNYNSSLNRLVEIEGPLENPNPPLHEYDKYMDVVVRGSFIRQPPCYARSSFSSPGASADARIAYHGIRPVRTLDISLSKKK